ncbi:hypothetical protein CC85DRAFT_297212 [Cutaneotrichosporon oleaginosum]|uniref:ER transporter 6TM N-terminal domain-containing protein n=1 Tax=Cutaneotrichosporon oleaginosum TaxID=879819 RepID=A0A0J0XIU8_9TREE|nr:uncharacterized protein CC85DRAFT_297212 [Cutaneotrichosporon oleaginosum]KLT41025.1 hypothetical protein CC85DRAFT_297212 [Cutaneotrichosporon oleaginosum]TXT12117.1 hypothetical protein COLE_02527 [Cutaneotrichosporon oleaginosum]
MWIGLLFLLIHPVGLEVGQAAFLVLIMSVMVPPSAPFVQFIEVMCNLYFYISLAWAWCCIGIRVADATRQPFDSAKVAAKMAQYAGESPTNQQMRVMFDGTYLQAGPAIVSCVWLSVGTAALLWWKMRTAPSPATLPLVLACILIDVTFTLVPLYPVADYLIPWIVYKPMCFQGAIALVCSILIPQSVSGQFRGRFNGVLTPLRDAMGDIESLFSDASSMSTFGAHGRQGSIVSFDERTEIDQKITAWGDRSAEIRVVLLKSLAGMHPLNAQQRYLDVDISYGRIPGRDLREIFNVLASVQTRASGFSFFFNTIVNKVRRTHLDSKGFNAQRSLSMATLSRPTSRSFSRPVSRPGSAISLKDLRDPRRSSASYRDVRRTSDVEDVPPTPRSVGFDDTPRDTPHEETTDAGTPDVSDDEASEREHREMWRGRAKHESLAHRLFHLPRSRDTSPHHDGDHDRSKERRRSRDRRRRRIKELKEHKDSLKGSALSLLDQLRKSQQPVGVYESQRYMDLESGNDRDLEKVIEQLELLSTSALPLVKALRGALTEACTWVVTSDKKRYAQARDVASATARLRVALAEFQEHRGVVTRPYRHLFDPSHKRDAHLSQSQHMGLFYCLVASYHLIEFSDSLLKLLDMLVDTDARRQRRRLWFPNLVKLFKQFRTSVKSDVSDGREETQEADSFNHAEENEDTDLLGQARRRNPDYKPYGSWGMGMLSRLATVPDILFSRSAMYGLKAGALGCLTSLPAFLASSASFYYYNRGIWCTIMAQMTLAVFAGDTFSSWVSRLLASFWGGLVGMVAWYIGSGSGPGNPYGIAAVTAVLFLPLMLFRVHWPGPPLTAIVFCTSVNLVIGYSYLNGHLFRMSNATWGFDVAWLRFVCVVIGITAAWIFSLVPPVYSAKRAIRYSYARAIANVGYILCQELSAANDPHSHANMEFNQHVRAELLSQRAKLTKLGMRHEFAQKELSLRGRWPKDVYAGLQSTLVETMSLLAMFNHLLPQMPPTWRKALLLRTRMCDPLFLGDVLAVISMTSSALRAATPLPQITPGPLIAKYHMNRYKGVELPDPAEGWEGMPTHVTADVLQSDDYMRYALGVSTIYALMSRLDSIVVVCKTLLGENYHIENLKLVETAQMIA